MMKIGILDSDDVGRVLATASMNEGHEVTLGTRNPETESVVKWKNDHARCTKIFYNDRRFFDEAIKTFGSKRSLCKSV